MKVYIKDKRDEIIWALSRQGYTNSQVGEIFNVDRSTILRIVERCPKEWKTKWIKR